MASMTLKQMKVDVRYVVTHPSVDGEFQQGDHIRLLKDGSILSREAEGWMEPADVKAATKGMRVAIDREWIAERRAELLRELELLDEQHLQVTHGK